MSPFPANLQSYLYPPAEGLLPKWLYLISIVSIGNTLQCYVGPTTSRKLYSQRPELVNALTARTFGTWTLATSIIRFYAAWNITDPKCYELAYITFWIAGLHFASEWLVYGTASLGKGGGLWGPIIVATSSAVWMHVCWNDYVR